MNSIYTVAEIVEKIKNTLESFFSNILIKGEVSGLKVSPSNHLYFSLKDEKNNILPCVFFRFNQKNTFIPKNGDEIVAYGNISTYNEKGIYQLKIESIKNIEKGSLQIAFEQLKKKLLEEGLFDEKYKKNLPFFPDKIGIITSITGAVIHDMLTLLKKRFENVSVVIYSVTVQGKKSAEEIIQAINDFNKLKNVEVIILARGGGSLEDLQPFNEENLARSIFNSEIPIISAIGHETDYTIADFVSDKRSPTPSAAIEIVIPNKIEIINKISFCLSKLYFFLNYKIKKDKKYFTNLIKRKIIENPIDVFIYPKLQKLDYLIENLSFKIKRKISNNFIYYQNLKNKFNLLSPQQKIKEMQINLSYLNLTKKMQNFLEQKIYIYETLSEKLDLLSPFQIMKRGYSVTFKLPEKKIIKSINQLNVEDEIEVKLFDGLVQGKVNKIL